MPRTRHLHPQSSSPPSPPAPSRSSLRVAPQQRPRSTAAPPSAAQAAASSRRSSRSGSPPSAPPSATSSSTARSARAAASAPSQARTVDFGASDAPLTPDQFTACKGCVQIPWALSATSVIYNLDGVKNLLHMDGPTLAKIFIGKITTWNDPAIAKLNPGRHAAEHEDRDRPPLGQLRHDVQLHATTSRRQPGLEVAVSASASPSTGPSAPARAAARASQRRQPDPRRHRLRRRRLREGEPPEVLLDEEQLGQVHDCRASAASSRPPRATRSRTRRRTSSRSSTRRRSTRSRIRSRPTPT